MRKIQLLIAFIILTTSSIFGQMTKMEVFQIGTKLAFYPNECGNAIPEAEGKLSFCDKAGNLGVVERSYGLNYRGVKKMFENHQNADEVYLTNNGVSIYHSDGSWENLPNAAFPGFNFTEAVIQEGLVTPNGDLILRNTNSEPKLLIYHRASKEVSTMDFPVGHYPTQLVYDTDRSLTWVLTRQSNSVSLYSFDGSSISFVADFSSVVGLTGLTNVAIKYRANHIVIGNGHGLFDINVANLAAVTVKEYSTTTTPSIPFDRVSDLQFDVAGALWMTMFKNSDGAIVKFDLTTGTHEMYQLVLETNPLANHNFKALAVDNAGKIWAVSQNYGGFVQLTFDGTTPQWSHLSKDSLTNLGYPYTYVPNHVYFKNDQFYFTTNDYSSGSNSNYEVLINQNDTWSGRNDDAAGSLSAKMNKRFKLSLPDDLGGVWWFNQSDKIVVYRDKDDEHQFIDLNTHFSAAIDADQKAIVYGGNPTKLQKIDFPNAHEIGQTVNQVDDMQRVGNQVWVYDRNAPKIDVFENENLVKSFDLDSADYTHYYHFAVDVQNNVWFSRSNGSGGNYIRKYNTQTAAVTMYDRPEKIHTVAKIVSGPDNTILLVGQKGLLLHKDNNWYGYPVVDYPIFFNVVDAVFDDNGKLYVLRNDLATITTSENPASATPAFESIIMEAGNSILPALKHYRPRTITIDSEGSIWTHASQNVFKLIDDDLAKQFQVSLVVANEELVNDRDVCLYPNPTNGLVTIQSDLQIDKVEIYSLLAQKMKTISHVTTFDANLPTGVYMVKIYSGKEVVSRKLVVN